MNLSPRQRAGIFVTLALVMMGTRINHFAQIPDASWALFFLGGFYLRGDGRWAFPALMALAVAVDTFVIAAAGLSFWNHYCVSLAYWFLVPAYLSLWLGGHWLRNRYQGLSFATAGWLLLAFLVSVETCYLLSNGSFYWLSDNVANRSFAGWLKNLGDWALPYLYTAGLYVGIGTLLHVFVAQVAARMSTSDAAPARERAR